MHHAMADGIAGVAAIGTLLDPAADATVRASPPWTPAAMPSPRDLLRDNMRWRIQGLHSLLPRIAHPVSTLRQAQSAWPAWRELWAEERAPRTSLNRPVGGHRSLALIRGRLDPAKRIAHAHDAKVNDIVLAAVSGGLRELLASRGEPVDALVLRAMVPVSLHHEQLGQARGNLDGMMIVPLPLGEPDPLHVLEQVAVETVDRKKKARPQAMTTGIFRFAVARRALGRLAKHQWLLNLAVSNVPGPPVPLYLAGAKLLEIFPVVPLVGNQTLNVGVLSYAGQLNMTAVADGDACPDIDVFAQGVRNTVEKLARSIVAT
jgi:diacylglycerol O-acyltransferase / wax synthase